MTDDIHGAGIALESKAIDDVRLSTDAHPDDDGGRVILKFSGIEGLTCGKIILSPTEATQLADDLENEVGWLGHSTKTVVDAPADE